MIRILISAQPCSPFPFFSISNLTMASIVRNVVHWGSHSQRQKPPVQVLDLCEVFRFFLRPSTSVTVNTDFFFLQRFVVKNQNLLKKASSIHTAVGAAHGMGKDPVRPLVYFVDVVRQVNLRLLISVQKHMPGTLLFILITHLQFK